MHSATVLVELIRTNLKLQHESTVLGVLWYLLGPLLLFGILLLVFSQRMGGGIEHYPLYLLLGLILWNFFATATSRSMTALMQNAALLKSFPLRKELFVLATVLTTFVSHLVELLVFVLVLLWFGVYPGTAWLFVPLLFLHVCLTLGVSFCLCGLYVHLRDIGQIWSVFLRAWWFATPIFYAASDAAIIQRLSVYNPLYYVIHSGRELLIYERSVLLSQWLVLVAMAVLSLLIGYAVFRKLTDRSLHLL